MKKYYVEFSFEPDDIEPLHLLVMAYSKQHVRDTFPDYNIVAIDQTGMKELG